MKSTLFAATLSLYCATLVSPAHADERQEMEQRRDKIFSELEKLEQQDSTIKVVPVPVPVPVPAEEAPKAAPAAPTVVVLPPAVPLPHAAPQAAPVVTIPRYQEKARRPHRRRRPQLTAAQIQYKYERFKRMKRRGVRWVFFGAAAQAAGIGMMAYAVNNGLNPACFDTCGDRYFHDPKTRRTATIGAVGALTLSTGLLMTAGGIVFWTIGGIKKGKYAMMMRANAGQPPVMPLVSYDPQTKTSFAGVSVRF